MHLGVLYIINWQIDMIKINKYMQSYFYLDGSKHQYWQKLLTTW